MGAKEIRRTLAFCVLLSLSLLFSDVILSSFRHNEEKNTDGDLVPGVTNILTLVYEVLSAVFTTIQCTRSLSFSGSSWKSQRAGLTYMVMQQGACICNQFIWMVLVNWNMI